MARLIFIEDNSELASVLVMTATTLGHASTHVSTGKGAIECLERDTFDMAVVDLLLPDMRGTEILVKLRERSIPAIAVSGIYKGERFVDEAINDYGALSFFEKPFDIARLFQAIGERVGVPKKPAEIELSPSEAASEVGEDLDFGIDEEEQQAPEEELLELIEPVEDEQAAEKEKAGAESPAPTSPSPPPVLDNEEATRRMQVSRSQLEAEQAAATVPSSPSSPEVPVLSEELIPTSPRLYPAEVELPKREPRKAILPDWSLAGELERYSMPRLLSAYYRARVDGQIEIKREKAVKLITFAKGEPVFAVSNLAAEKLGRFCVQRGWVTAEAITEAGHDAGTITPEQLNGSGLVTGEALANAVRDRMRALIIHSFTWKNGTYRFSQPKTTKETTPSVVLHPGRLILEGIVETETLLSLREKLALEKRLFPVPDPPFVLNGLNLSVDLARLLICIDGTKSIEDLLQITEMNEREARAGIHAFEILGLVEERKEASRSQRVTYGL